MNLPFGSSLSDESIRSSRRDRLEWMSTTKNSRSFLLPYNIDRRPVYRSTIIIQGSCPSPKADAVRHNALRCQHPSFENVMQYHSVPFLFAIRGPQADYVGQRLGSTEMENYAPSFRVQEPRPQVRCFKTTQFFAICSAPETKGGSIKVVEIIFTTSFDGRLGRPSSHSIVISTLHALLFQRSDKYLHQYNPLSQQRRKVPFQEISIGILNQSTQQKITCNSHSTILCVEWTNGAKPNWGLACLPHM